MAEPLAIGEPATEDGSRDHETWIICKGYHIFEFPVGEIASYFLIRT
jgi:hypothetical protein